MRATRRFVSLLALATLVALPASLPALAQSGTASDVTHRQSIRTEMGPDGEVKASRVFTQLTVVGDGQVDLTLTNQSTTGLRNLDGFGRPRVEGDQVIHSVSASRDGARERTVAENTADLPIEFGVTYSLDGEEIAPKDLVGKTGDLTVTFDVRNTTAQPTEVRYFDGRQTAVNETIDVAVPFVGSVSMTLPPQFVDIDAPAASVAGNGRGDTVVSWSMVLFEPVGSEEQSVSYTARVTDAVVPEVVGQFLPVDSRSFSSLKSVQETFGGVADGLTSLTTGALIVDGNVQLLAAGSAQLLDGLDQLADGAGQLSAGLNDSAVPGSRQLADGMGQARAGGRQLADGLLELEDGAGQISDGLGAARAGSGELASGLQALADGAAKLRAGMGSAFSGGQALSDGLSALAAGATALEAGAGQLAAGAVTLDEKTGELVAGTVQIKDGAAGLLGGLETLKAALNAPTGTAKLIAGVDQLSAGVAGLINGIGTTTTDKTLLNGIAQLQAGSGELKGGLDQLLGGINEQVSPGLGKLVAALETGVPTGTPLETKSVKQLVAEVRQTLIDEKTAALVGGGMTDPEEIAAALAADPLILRLSVALGILGSSTDFSVPDAMDPTSVLGGLAKLRAGVGGTTPAVACDAAKSEFATISGLGLTPPLTLVVRVLSCGAGDLGLGLAQLQGGVSNPGALALNPTCAPTTDPARACGLREGALLIAGGLDNPAAEAVGTSTYNPQCLAPGDTGYRSGMAPCGLKQGLKLSLAAINAGLGSTTDDPATNPTLLGGANALAEGSKALSAGAAQLREEGTGPLAAGAGQVAGGAGQLADGAGAASAGSGQLVDGLGQLDAGAGELAAGAGKAADGGKALGSGLVQLDDGARKLYAGSGTAANGANDLANGLVQLDDGANQLADGLGDAGDGSQQIAEGLVSARDGGEQIADGTQALTDRGMSQIIEGASEGAKTPAQAVAHARAADARGKAGEGLPYGTVDGATATAVYQFELAGIGGADDGASTPVKAAATLAAFGIAGALGLGLRRTLA
jgi:putative membrane protein